jgi:hypothetical protein
LYLESPFRELVDCLPLEYVDYIFAYGSGVIQQQNEPKSDKMVDFIVVTRDTYAFHEHNCQQNPRHYSAIRFLGITKLTQFQRYCGACLFFNTRIKTSFGPMMKYGIIDRKVRILVRTFNYFRTFNKICLSGDICMVREDCISRLLT